MQMSISPNALARDVTGGQADGSTYCDYVSCSADVNVTFFPSILPVDDGDNVIYYYDVSWDDDREQYAPLARHFFEIWVYYPGRDLYRESKSVYTSGDQSGSDRLTIEVLDVDESVTVQVHWYAGIYIDPCFDDDYGGGLQSYS